MTNYSRSTLAKGLLALSWLVSSVFVVIASTVVVQAAPAGCYERYAGDGKYRTVVCPAAQASAVESGTCFVKTVAPRQGSTFVETDCNSINASDVVADPVANGEDDPTKVSDVTIELNPTKDTCGTGQCITDTIIDIVNALTIGVGVIITIVIIVSGIQYTISRDNPQTVQAAKTRILNAVIAFIAYIFIFSFLQWVVPGGLF